MSLGYDEMAVLCPELACTFTFGGVATWVGVRGDLTESKQLGDGGLALTADLQLAVPLAQFTDAGVTPPAEKDAITVDGADYHVGAVTKDPEGTFLLLALYAASRGV